MLVGLRAKVNRTLRLQSPSRWLGTDSAILGSAHGHHRTDHDAENFPNLRIGVEAYDAPARDVANFGLEENSDEHNLSAHRFHAVSDAHVISS
jgi:hypothetical protein